MSDTFKIGTVMNPEQRGILRGHTLVCIVPLPPWTGGPSNNAGWNATNWPSALSVRSTQLMAQDKRRGNVTKIGGEIDHEAVSPRP